MKFGLLPVAAVVTICCAPVRAQQADAQPVPAADDQEIIVTGRHEGYALAETSSATKTATALIDVPQSVTLVTAEEIADRAFRSIADAVRGVPGVTIGQGEGHRDQVSLRGNNTTADFFVDGIRDDVQYFRGLYNVERIEVLKGSNALIFGRGGGGGVINRVSKVPVAGQTFGEFTGSVDTFGAWYVSGDGNLPIAGNAAVRLNAVYESFANHRDVYDGDRFAINPTIGVELPGGGKIGLSYEYARDDRVIDRGVPSLGGAPITGFRDVFFGVEGVNISEFEGHIAKLRYEQPLSDALTLNGIAVYGDYEKLYQNAFAATAVDPLTQTLGVEAYRDPTHRTSFFTQTNLVWRGQTGGIGHVVLAGVEFGDQNTANQRINGFFDSGVPTTNAGRRTVIALSDRPVFPPITFRAGSGNRSIDARGQLFSAYVQDQISLGDHFELVGGVRFDSFRVRVDNLLTSQRFQRTDDIFSPRAGAIWKPRENLSVYASYARSFLPQSGDQFVSLDVTLEALAPEKFDNYELGVKWNIQPGLAFTSAIYQLDRSNTRANGPNPGEIVLTGKQRSQGIELGLTGQITPDWQVAAGYAYQDAEIVDGTTAAPDGRKVAQVPRHQLSLWNRYDVSDRLGIGLGVYHLSSQFATISNAVRLPSYTRVDAALYFQLTDQLEAQVNIENLLNERYFPTAHTDNNITTGAPTNARFTLTARF